MGPGGALYLGDATATFMLAVFYVVAIQILRRRVGRPVRLRPWPNRHPQWRRTLFKWLRDPRCRLVFDEGSEKIEVPPANRHLRRRFQRRGVPVPDDLLEELNFWDDAEAMWYLLDWLSGLDELLSVVSAFRDDAWQLSEPPSELSWYVPAEDGPASPSERARSRPILRHAPPALAVPIREAVAA